MTETLQVGLPDPTPYLLPGETVRLVVRRHHPIVLAPAAMVVTLIVLASLAVLLLGTPSAGVLSGGVLVVLAALLYFAYRYVHWSRTVLVVTNRRLFQFESLGVKRVTVMPVIRQSIVFRQSPLGRALGFATVQVRTANGSVLYNFGWLRDATRFRDEVTNIAA
jgi:membrane protein YdbS with pleckstrin-like domain